jgi:hypothetical protein
MSQYQGHLSDGSSVQKHSAGGIYPFVPFGVDRPNGKLCWGITTPGGRDVLVGNYSDAIDLAVQLKSGSTCARVLAEMRSNLLGLESLESLETLSGEPRTEPEGDTWFARRDWDDWYAGLVRAGLTTEMEILSLQLQLVRLEHGQEAAPGSLARHQELRSAARSRQLLDEALATPPNVVLVLEMVDA